MSGLLKNSMVSSKTPLWKKNDRKKILSGCRLIWRRPVLIVSCAEFEIFCYEEPDDKENAVLLFVYEEGNSYETVGNFLSMTQGRIIQTEVKIVRKVRKRFPESVHVTGADPEEVIPDHDQNPV